MYWVCMYGNIYDIVIGYVYNLGGIKQAYFAELLIGSLKDKNPQHTCHQHALCYH